jgi:hypothetical protein
MISIVRAGQCRTEAEGEYPAMDHAAIPVEKMDELLRFLPLFEVSDREYVKEWGGGETTSDGKATQVPYPIYCDDAFEFFTLAGQTHWSDFGYNPREAYAMLLDDEFISAASLSEFKTMLTYCVRGERFADGHWAHMLESGRIVALLRRLAVLREELR